jgi:serine/threonine protein kinase
MRTISSFTYSSDIKFDNIMMDSAPLYDGPIHPVEHHMSRDYTRSVKQQTRTLCPVKYYLIDFGNACHYNPEEGPPRVPVHYGGDRSVPEFTTETVCDPFAVDVYRIGNVIRTCFTKVRSIRFRAFSTLINVQGDATGYGKKLGFKFMEPLLEDMCQRDPQKRPTMSEVVSRFGQIIKGLYGWKLRSRVVPATEPALRRAVLFPGHWTRQIIQFTQRIPAIPAA